MLVMITIITLLLTPKFSATILCVENVANFTIELQRRIADVLMSKGAMNTTDTYELDYTVGESKLLLLVIRRCYSYQGWLKSLT